MSNLIDTVSFDQFTDFRTVDELTNRHLSTLTRIAEEREHASISRGIKKVASIVRGFDKETDRNE